MPQDRTHQPNVVPIWWDRYRRKITFGGGAFLPAVMIFDSEFVSAVSADRVIFELALAEITPRWLGKYCCDLTSHGDIYRIYFMPPNKLARRLDKTTAERIGGIASNAERVGGGLGHLLSAGAVVGDYAAILGFVGKAISFYQTMSDLNVARASVSEFRSVLQ